MRRFTIAAVAVLAIAGSTAVYAQRSWFSEHMHHMRMNPEDRAAFADAKIASVHAGLKLTADQEKLWPPVETAVRGLVKIKLDRANARMQPAAGDAQKAEDPVARLREHAETMAATADAMKKIADAADPLYKSLDEGQKRRLAMLTHREGHHRGGPEGWRHRWMEHGEGGPDGPHHRDRMDDLDGEEGSGRL